MDLLEDWDADVIYDFDRDHEGEPDAYRASGRGAGVELVFDEHQTLTTVFLHAVASGDYASADLASTDIAVFESKVQAAAHAAAHGIEMAEGQATLGGTQRDWIRFEADTHTVHYEFRDGVLGLVTLTAR